MDSDTQEADGDLRHLRGHVHLETSDKKLDADAVDYNDDTGDVEAWGNVRYENFTDGTKLNCDRAKYNVNTETGIFYDVRGTSETRIVARPGLLTTSNPFYFEGKWGERVDGKYIIHEGFVTDCKVPKPWWRLSSAKFDILPHDRAITYHAVFRVKKVPIFYFPAYYKSLKTLPRQSGFLTPNIGHSSLYGEMFGLAYYWAISRSYDALYRIQYFTLRGPANTLELRGKVRPGTEFSFNLYAVEDRGVNIGNGVIQKQGGEEFTFDGHSDLGHGWLARGHLDYLSSFLFRLAFSQSFHDTIFSETHSVGFITKHWSSYAFDVVADRDQEFENANPLDTIIIKKLPEADFLGRERKILGGVIPVWFSFNSRAGFLDRSQPEFQTPKFVGRLDVYPEVTTAFHFGGFNLTATGAIRETEYGSRVSSTARSATKHSAQCPRGRCRAHATRLRADLSVAQVAGRRKSEARDRATHRVQLRRRHRQFQQYHPLRRDRSDERHQSSDVVADQSSAGEGQERQRQRDSELGSGAEPLFRSHLRRRRDSGPAQRAATTEDLDGFDFLDGPRNYSPIVSVLRFQHVVGFEWRMDYDPMLGRIRNSSFNGNVRLSKYFFSLGHTEVNTNPVIVAPQRSDQRADRGRQSKPQRLERRGERLSTTTTRTFWISPPLRSRTTPTAAASAWNTAATTSGRATTRNIASHFRSPTSDRSGICASRNGFTNR